MGIPVVKGRDFSPFDNENSLKVAIINQTMAKYFWPGTDDAAIGKHFHFYNDTINWQIVGIARDATYLEIGEKPRPMIYLPLSQAYAAAGDAARAHDRQSRRSPLPPCARKCSRSIPTCCCVWYAPCRK